MRRLTVGFVLGLGLLGCTMSNPAFDEPDELGDGDPTTGDGEPTTTGDGDPTTTGDGDPTTGDGDPTTTGDGDGDPMTTGDGDGEPMTTGDGDGDIDLCDAPPVDEPYEPAEIFGAVNLEVADAPGFAQQGLGCQILTVCVASQADCGPNSAYIVRIDSGGLAVPGLTPPEPVPIRINFSPGKPACGMPLLSFDQSQSIKIYMVNNLDILAVLPIRLPCFEGTELDLWVGQGGSSFYDSELLDPAALW